jgi:hypothetical protein
MYGTPAFGLPAAPALSGGGFAMQMQMSGDPGMVLLLPALIRSFLGQVVGGGAAGTDSRLGGLANLTANELRALIAGGMTDAIKDSQLMTKTDAKNLADELKRTLPQTVIPVVIPILNEILKSRGLPPIPVLPATSTGRSSAPSPELAEARRLLDEIVVLQNNPASTPRGDTATVRNEVRQLLNEIASLQAPKAPAGTSVASRAK